jgi:hypothetical protein
MTLSDPQAMAVNGSMIGCSVSRDRQIYGVRLLLTSAGITNDSIRGALVDLLGKPVEERLPGLLQDKVCFGVSAGSAMVTPVVMLAGA